MLTFSRLLLTLSLFLWLKFAFAYLVNDVLLDLTKGQEAEMEKWRGKVKDKMRDMYQQSYFTEAISSAEDMLTNSKSVFSTLNTAEKRNYAIKFGHIALYMRIFKHWSNMGSWQEEEGKKANNHSNSRRYFEFPQPFLKRLADDVAANCSENVFKCTDAVYEHVKFFYGFSSTRFWVKNKDREANLLSSKILINRRNYRIFHKSSDKFDLTTAYYFCWLTQIRAPLLAHLPYCDYAADSGEFHWPFLYNYRNYSGGGMANPVTLILDGNVRREPLIDVLNETPFECAEFSFCPDPCCGRPYLLKNATDLPCKSKCDALSGAEFGAPPATLSTTGCQLKKGSNTGFIDIVRSNWNITCLNCPNSEHQVYDTVLGACVDLDECATGKATCNGFGKTCLNTPKSALCVCSFGYEMDEWEDCIEILPPNEKILLLKEGSVAVKMAEKNCANVFLVLFLVLFLFQV